MLVYNEAYVAADRGQAPGRARRPAREVFPEAWDAIGPMMEARARRRRRDVDGGRVGPARAPRDARGGVLHVLLLAGARRRRRDRGRDRHRRRDDAAGDRPAPARAAQPAPRALGDLARGRRAAAGSRPALRDDRRRPAATYDLRRRRHRDPGSDPRRPGCSPDEPLRGGRRTSVTCWLPLGPPETTRAPRPRCCASATRSRPTTRTSASCAWSPPRWPSAAGPRDGAARPSAQLSEALQRSLLTRAAAQPERCRSRSATAPAAERAQIGGDWYDAFSARRRR